MKIAFYGSSLLSSYWNGAATYYRGVLRQLAHRGWDVHFYEPDAFDRQQHRDMDPPDWAKVTVWEATPEDARRVMAQAAYADVVVKASGVGVFDDELLHGLLDTAAPEAVRMFCDVDAAATLDEMRAAPDHPLRKRIGDVDLVTTYGGGPPVIAAYTEAGARRVEPIYNALDPETHHPVDPDPRFAADLNFLANRLPDREARVEAFFLRAAECLPDKRFLLGGNGWDDKPMTANVQPRGPRRHGATTTPSTPPARRAERGARQHGGHGLLAGHARVRGGRRGRLPDHDAWEGIEMFLQPDSEVLVAPRRPGRGRALSGR
jgi:spore maturation protein CgeB